MVELDESQFKLFMAVIASSFAFFSPKGSRDQSGVAARRVEQIPLARGLEMRNGSLNQMARAVELVKIAQFGPTALWLNLGKPEIEISIRLL